jgi:hypothetical protein
MNHKTAYVSIRGDYDTDTAAHQVLELPNISGSQIVKLVQVYVSPEVNGAGVASYQVAVGSDTVAALTDTGIRYLSSAKTVAAGTAPRPVAEWTTKDVGDNDVIIQTRVTPSSSGNSRGCNARIEFDAGTGHTGKYEFIFEIIRGA